MCAISDGLKFSVVNASFEMSLAESSALLSGIPLKRKQSGAGEERSRVPLLRVKTSNVDPTASSSLRRPRLQPWSSDFPAAKPRSDHPSLFHRFVLWWLRDFTLQRGT